MISQISDVIYPIDLPD